MKQLDNDKYRKYRDGDDVVEWCHGNYFIISDHPRVDITNNCGDRHLKGINIRWSSVLFFLWLCGLFVLCGCVQRFVVCVCVCVCVCVFGGIVLIFDVLRSQINPHICSTRFSPSFDPTFLYFARPK